MNKVYRQGDILLIKIEKCDVNLKEVKEQVLAYGEATGHKHLLVKERPETKIEIANDGVGYYLKISNGNAVIRHEEHKKIVLEPGIYRQIRQFEYDPIEYQRKVQD